MSALRGRQRRPRADEPVERWLHRRLTPRSGGGIRIGGRFRAGATGDLRGHGGLQCVGGDQPGRTALRVLLMPAAAIVAVAPPIPALYGARRHRRIAGRAAKDARQGVLVTSALPRPSRGAGIEAHGRGGKGRLFQDGPVLPLVERAALAPNLSHVEGIPEERVDGIPGPLSSPSPEPLPGLVPLLFQTSAA